MPETTGKNEVPNQESKLDKLVHSKTEAYALLKPDAMREGCVPTIIQILTDNGFHISKFIEIDVSREDAGRLYEGDLQKAQDETRKREVVAGIDNLTGKCIALSLYRKPVKNETAWEELSEIKGNARLSGIRTIRGKLCFPPPPDLSEDDRLKWVAKTRVHAPWDFIEIRALGNLLIKKGIV